MIMSVSAQLRLLALWIAVKLGSGVDFFQLSEKLSNTALTPSFLGHSARWEKQVIGGH